MSIIEAKLNGIASQTGKVKIIVAAIILIIMGTLPFWGSGYMTNVFLLIFLYMSIGMMWNLLSGYAGLTSLGQQAFIGIGGYSVAVLTQVYGLSLIWGFAVGSVVGVVFALVISMPIFKMNGAYFTIGTWIIAEALYIFFVKWEFVNYGIGYPITAAYGIPMWGLYLASFIVGIGSIVIVTLLLKSRLGLTLMAMRDDSGAAEVRGVKLYRTKLICYLIAAFWVTITGCLLFLNQAYIVPSSAFTIDWTIACVFIVIIGGIGTIEGPIVGAVIYVFLRQILYGFPGISNIILGIIAIIIIIVAPKGIMGYLNNKFNLDIFSIRRRIKR
ncbi:MAG: branched-chain amino acid ABC transporter permease [Clostridiales bacterium]|jgi:branched-chain amino acid transport system permease protein|nr:branched-chain amino acid ABC transporter permease [Clostridiales bacterium]